MLKCSPWGRAVFTSATLLVCAAACDSVLDIEPPKMRRGAGGEAGAPAEPIAGKGSSGERNAPQGGDTGAAGEPPVVVGNAGAGGEGGEPPARECETDATRCNGADAKTPEVCDASGHWTPNKDEADGDCPSLCANGKCTECKDGDRQCTVCADGDPKCTQRLPQTCVNGAWVDAKKACDHFCAFGECGQPPSCGAPSDPDSICSDGASCCRSIYVPGGVFQRNFDEVDPFNVPDHPAEVSPFLLDKFEVTVGRMRRFVDAYPSLVLPEGKGQSKRVEGDEGWHTSFELPKDKDALQKQLQCVGATWSDSVDADSHLPINCVTFAVAYAFCIWDGGRLPTETEWNFAAAGGNEHRMYPWVPTGEDAINDTYAYYYALEHLLPIAVGSKLPGNGRWGHSDLAGNVSEWMLDFFQDPPMATCKDCLETTASSTRVRRGGSYLQGGEVLVVPNRNDNADPSLFTTETGMRCARDLFK
jgi:formylglycine-generating enzyme required for sulfatase activity